MRKIPVPDGAKLYVTSTLPAAVGTGAATNAASAVVTIADHGIDLRQSAQRLAQRPQRQSPAVAGATAVENGQFDVYWPVK